MRFQNDGLKRIWMRIRGLKTGALAYIPFSERFIFLRLFLVKNIVFN